MGLVLLTGPAEEPVTVDEAKAHLRVDSAADDALIGSLITGAREYVESFLRRALVTQTWDLFMDEFPAGDVVELPWPRLRTVESIQYHDAAGSSTTFSSSNYIVDAVSEPGRVVLKSGVSWPAVELRAVNGFQVRFTAGYGGASAVPQGVKRAILLLVGAMYENREEVIVAQGVSIASLPFGTWALLRPHRVYRWN